LVLEILSIEFVRFYRLTFDAKILTVVLGVNFFMLDSVVTSVFLKSIGLIACLIQDEDIGLNFSEV
jgi:hypothetical protein